jgi:hypothetical protein
MGAPAPQPVPKPAPKKGHAIRNIGIGCGGFLLLLIIVGIATQGGTQNTSSNSNQSQIASPSTTASPTSRFANFGNGTHQVGSDIQPGTYRTRSGADGCYFARLKGFGGGLDDLIANENTNDPAVVTIAATDKGFQSTRCARWTQDLSAITTSQTSFGNGDYIVGTDIAPGRYRSSGREGCYYARLRGFGHTLDDLITNENTNDAAVVTIAATDKGFESARCATWTKIG